MEFREYSAVDPRDVLALNMLALGFHLDEDRMAAAREHDRRLEPYLALYAVEDGKAIGQVGAMCITLETTEGPQQFGALWAVATHPDHTRKGVASQLIEQVHGRFRDRGLRYSYLTTSRSLVAHRVYRLLGYEDLAAGQQHLAYPGVCAGAGTVETAGATLAGARPLCWTQVGQSDAATAVAIHRAATEGKLGFVHRGGAFLHGAAAHGDLAWDDLLVLRAGSEPVGYAIAKRRPECVSISDLHVLPEVPLTPALLALRQTFPDNTLISGCNSPRMRDALREAGFVGGSSSGPGVLMVAGLCGPTDIGLVRRLLGVGTEAFAFGSLDST